MKKITSIPTKSVQNLEISDDMHSTVETGYMESPRCFYYCEFSHEGKSCEGVIEAVRVRVEDGDYSHVEWEGDTVRYVSVHRSFEDVGEFIREIHQ